VPLAERYPLQLISPHPKHSFHTHNDNKSLWIDRISQHRIHKDGYAWWPVRINPADASERDIKHGDIVKVYNNRGAVLAIATITERVRPGTVHSYEGGSKYDPLEPGVPGCIDRGGCMNLLTSGRLLSKNVPGMASNSCLVEISRWEK
jgi:trimethylamine-N-oxide reductase (cytochrome c)